MIRTSILVATLIAIGMGVCIGLAASFQASLQQLAIRDHSRGIPLRGWLSLPGRVAAYALTFALILGAAFLVRWGTAISRAAFGLIWVVTATIVAFPVYYLFWKPRIKREDTDRSRGVEDGGRHD
jgi:hypothetical protein